MVILNLKVKNVVGLFAEKIIDEKGHGNGGDFMDNQKRKFIESSRIENENLLSCKSRKIA